MREVSAKDARENFKAIIDRVTAGESIKIMRRSKVVAHLVPPETQKSRRAPSMEQFRQSLKVKGKPMSLEVVEARQRERY